MNEQIENNRELLVQGVQALLNGQREEAQGLLMAYIEQNEKSEEGWLWLSGAVDDPEDIQVALENCLSVNPNNERARQGLAWVEQHR